MKNKGCTLDFCLQRRRALMEAYHEEMSKKEITSSEEAIQQCFTPALDFGFLNTGPEMLFPE